MIASLSHTFLKIIGGNQGQSGLSDLTNLKPGQVINAKVLEVKSENSAQLLVNGQKLTVSTKLPLTQGMDLPMKVVRSQDGIVLKPLSELPTPASSTATGQAVDSASGSAMNSNSTTSSAPVALPDSDLLSGTEKTFQSTSFQFFSPAKILQGLGALSQAQEPVLNDILMGLSLKSDIPDDQFLPKLIENMGLSFEKKLATALENVGDKKTIANVINQLADQDLKAASLSLAGGESDSSKASVLKHIADALDNFAQLNVKSGDSGQQQDGARFLLPFPVWQDDGFDFGQLMVDTGKAGSENNGKKMLSISFLLNMTSLGPLRADFSILDKTIAGRFLLENEETCDYLATKISDLKKGFSGIGYQTGNIDCQVATPEQIAPASLMLSMTGPDEIQGLDVVV